MSIQVKFQTKLDKYSVPDTTLVIPSSSTNSQLEAILKGLLKSTVSSNELSRISFDFLCINKLIRSSLEEHIREKDESLLESIISIEYIEKFQGPQPEDALMHDDWVSACRSLGDSILVASYDTNLHLWNNQGEHIISLPGHTAPVKSIYFIYSDEGEHKFISGSHDQTIFIWKYDQNKNNVQSLISCKGHQGTIETLAAQINVFCSGSFDKTIKLWGLDEEEGEEENKSSTKECRLTINAHNENVSSIGWISSNQLVSSSWDQTIKLWNMDTIQTIQNFKCGKAVLSLDISPVNGLLVCGFTDRFIRLYDTRIQEGYVLRSTYSSHSQWVSSVMWSRKSEYLFVSGSYDSLVKLWDTRSLKAPLYDLQGHEDRVLCVDWSIDQLILSGGADNSLKMFSFK
ncbi:unnamed protein product [Rotaria sp. Silwood1]|nr:unnamed protein product [Rotaria sp. Silwood1]CAF1489850.1 unnamed protein product [Rotaria sp. Silwood1]CAF4864483.1 unnamed protein product [Rotaria sp. Silwood1]CAF4979179.1 unnamed protein product [Rotaria sp. Silwood1]